jgi:C-8 sterol isomerase
MARFHQGISPSRKFSMRTGLNESDAQHRFYVFDPSLLHQLAQSAIASASAPDATNEMVSHILTNLTATYPRTSISINTDSSEWVLNNAGGAMGGMFIIHASITEYLIIFGTPLGTEGHTGLHTADDYFNILVGEQWAFDPSKSLAKEVYPPGSVHHLPRGYAKQYKMHEGCYALEYARGLLRLFLSCHYSSSDRTVLGWIPLMLPFGLADIFTSTLDLPTLYHTCRVTGREMFKNLLLGKI